MLVLSQARILTLDIVERALANVVNKYGPDATYVERQRVLTGNTEYEGCRYTLKAYGADIPACIVGVVLVDEFNVPVDVLADRDTNGVICEVALKRIEVPGYDAIDDAAMKFLSTAQQVQDDRSTWGEALYRAREATDLLPKPKPVRASSEEEDKCLDLARGNDAVLTAIDEKAKVRGVKVIMDAYNATYGERPTIRSAKNAYEEVEKRVLAIREQGTSKFDDDAGFAEYDEPPF